MAESSDGPDDHHIELTYRVATALFKDAPWQFLAKEHDPDDYHEIIRREDQRKKLYMIFKLKEEEDCRLMEQEIQKRYFDHDSVLLDSSECTKADCDCKINLEYKSFMLFTSWRLKTWNRSVTDRAVAMMKKLTLLDFKVSYVLLAPKAVNNTYWMTVVQNVNEVKKITPPYALESTGNFYRIDHLIPDKAKDFFLPQDAELNRNFSHFNPLPIAQFAVFIGRKCWDSCSLSIEFESEHFAVVTPDLDSQQFAFVLQAPSDHEIRSRELRFQRKVFGHQEIYDLETNICPLADCKCKNDQRTMLHTINRLNPFNNVLDFEIMDHARTLVEDLCWSVDFWVVQQKDTVSVEFFQIPDFDLQKCYHRFLYRNFFYLPIVEEESYVEYLSNLDLIFDDLFSLRQLEREYLL